LQVGWFVVLFIKVVGVGCWQLIHPLPVFLKRIVPIVVIIAIWYIDLPA